MKKILTIVGICLIVGCGTPTMKKQPKDPVRPRAIYSSNAGIKTADGVFTHLLRAYKDIHRSERGGFELAVIEYQAHLEVIFLIENFKPSRSSGPYLNIEQRGIDAAANAINEIQLKMKPSPSPTSAKINVLSAGCRRFLEFIGRSTMT